MKKTAIFLLLAGLAASASASRQWLMPSTSIVESKEGYVIIEAVNSETLFEYDGNGIKLDGLSIVGPAGAVATTETPHFGKLRTSFDLKLPKEGTYKVALANETVFATWKQGGEMKRYRGDEAGMAKEVPANAEELKVMRFHQRLETFVTLRTPDHATFPTSGVGIELVALTNPTDLRTGEQARWRFLVDGKPAADFPFSLIPAGQRYRGTMGELRFSTDAKGEAAVTLPAAGMYYLLAASPAPGPQGTPPPARRLSYGATLEILPQ